MALQRTTKLTYPGGYRLRIEMEDDVFGELDLTSELQQPELAKLLDLTEFAAAYVDPKGVIVWPCGLALHPERLFLRLKLQQFVIGAEFEMSGSRWRCTDVGARTLVAIQLDAARDPSWYRGPPYAVVETAIDEYDLPACMLTPPHMRLARERFEAGEASPTLPPYPLIRRRADVRENVWIKYCAEGVARIGRGERVLERAFLEDIAKHNALASELLSAPRMAFKTFALAAKLLDEFLP